MTLLISGVVLCGWLVIFVSYVWSFISLSSLLKKTTLTESLIRKKKAKRRLIVLSWGTLLTAIGLIGTSYWGVILPKPSVVVNLSKKEGTTSRPIQEKINKIAESTPRSSESSATTETSEAFSEKERPVDEVTELEKELSIKLANTFISDDLGKVIIQGTVLNDAKRISFTNSLSEEEVMSEVQEDKTFVLEYQLVDALMPVLFYVCDADQTSLIDREARLTTMVLSSDTFAQNNQEEQARLKAESHRQDVANREAEELAQRDEDHYTKEP